MGFNNIQRAKFFEINEIISSEGKKRKELEECYCSISDPWWIKEIAERLYQSNFHLFLAHLDMLRFLNDNNVVSKNMVDIWKDKTSDLSNTLRNFYNYFPI